MRKEKTAKISWISEKLFVRLVLCKSFQRCHQKWHEILMIWQRLRAHTSINFINLGNTGFLFIAMRGTLGQTSGTTTVAGSAWVMGAKSSSGGAPDPSSAPLLDPPESEPKVLLAVRRSCLRFSCSVWAKTPFWILLVQTTLDVRQVLAYRCCKLWSVLDTPLRMRRADNMFYM